MTITTPSTPSAPAVAPVKGDKRRRIISGVLAGASLLAVGGLASGAFFTDHDEITGNKFDFGTMSLSTYKTVATIGLPNMQPGSYVAAPLTIINDGSIDLITEMQSLVDNQVMANALNMTIVDVPEGESCTRMTIWTAETVNYEGPLGATEATEPGLGGIGTYNLAVGESKTLCVLVEAPNDIDDNALMGQKVDATFTFDSIQQWSTFG